MSDLVRTVSDVLSRADTLFGAVGAEPPGAAHRLTDAADAIRSGQSQAATMSADTLTNYADFAHGRGDALQQLSGVETDLGGRLQEAADAAASAKAASQSALDAVSSTSQHLDQLTDTPAAELAVIASLRAHIGGQLELLRAHQAVAVQLGEQLRGLPY
jgi:hypothetical protein